MHALIYIRYLLNIHISTTYIIQKNIPIQSLQTHEPRIEIKVYKKSELLKLGHIFF